MSGNKAAGSVRNSYLHYFLLLLKTRSCLFNLLIAKCCQDRYKEAPANESKPRTWSKQEGQEAENIFNHQVSGENGPFLQTRYCTQAARD